MITCSGVKDRCMKHYFGFRFYIGCDTYPLLRGKKGFDAISAEIIHPCWQNQ